ncbi:MAG: prepilin-type N-terminal cleavage/methylation domain-containing protein [Tepidanaerobacteraceae bacterium]|nr:prepilin-type N-terminal cleavage/methylation domain-containing protein [Tepidanaerobacteraceae bacterium]
MKIGRALHKRAKGEKGFTLIELIVVIAVLGVLTTLVIPRVIGVKEDAETAIDDANEKIIRNALERYYAKEGEYPSDTEGLSVLEEDYLDKDYSTEWNYSRNTDKKGYSLTKN